MKRILFALSFFATCLTQAATITDVRVSGAGPVTFGQVFAVGDMKASDVLVGKIDGATVPLQVDVKATHADGSVRHAIISAQVPKAGTMQLATTSGASGVTPGASEVMTGANIPAVEVSATIAGVRYSALANQLAKPSWISGPIANEWQTVAPLTTAAGVAHPHLTARFAMRYYTASKKTRVDVTVENDWAYEPGPQNFTYDTEILVGGKSVYSKAALTHYTHARWRKVFWDGPTVQLNTKYLIASKAIANYDQAVVVPDSVLVGYRAAAPVEPMSIGMATAYMPTTGGRLDIGLLPGWATIYALTMSDDARKVMLGTADGAGSWSMHYRDRNTDRPISVRDFPYMTINGRSTDTGNPKTGKYEAFPPCADCATPYTHDNSHQPNLVYLPYLVTGDYYYLEELQFWAMWNVFSSNPGYRGNEKGLLISEQMRGQAWGLRTLADAAYATPDADPLKSHFLAVMSDNLDWYNSTYTNSTTANKLGVVVNGYAISYGDTGIAPWQDDFFTSAVGHAADLGFDKALPLLKWKAKFPVDRMVAPGACWIDATIYSMNVRASGTAPFYDTMAQVYAANHTPEVNALTCNSPAMASAFGLKVGEMTGYADGNMGYPSNMQPALAYSVDSGVPGAAAAWALFQSRTVKPNYGDAPQFAIVPRGVVVPPPVIVQPLPVPVKIGKVTTGTNTKLVKQNPLTVTFIDPANLALVKSFAGVVATSKGSFTVSDVLLIPGAQYLVIVSSTSKPLDAFLLTVPK